MAAVGPIADRYDGSDRIATCIAATLCVSDHTLSVTTNGPAEVPDDLSGWIGESVLALFTVSPCLRYTACARSMEEPLATADCYRQPQRPLPSATADC